MHLKTRRYSALAGMAQVVEHPPSPPHWVASYIPGQGTCLELRVWSPVGARLRGTQSFSHTLMFLSLSFSLPSPSLKINK